MRTFTKRLLPIFLAAVMIFGNAAPAAATNGDIFGSEDKSTWNEGDLFGEYPNDNNNDGFFVNNAATYTAEAPAAGADHVALPKEPMKDSAQASSEEPATGGNPYGDGPAEWAFDGNVGKPWHSRYFDTKAEPPHTLEWNLGTEGQVFEVSKLHYHMKGDANSGNGLWQKVTVQVFNGAEQTLTQDFEVPDGDCDLVFSQTVTGTRMKVTVTQGEGGYACAGEIEVYGKQIGGEPTPPPTPVTEVGPVALAGDKEYRLIPQEQIQNPTAKSENANTDEPHSGDGPAAWAFDGLTASAWHCHYTNGALPQWIRWELGGTRLVGQIGYVRRDNGNKNDGNGRWKDIEVVGILPGGGEKVLTSGRIAENKMTKDGAEVLIGFEPTEVTALKVTVTDSYNTSGQYAQAGEIRTYEVVDKEVTPPPVTHDYKIVVTPAELTLNEGETGTVTAKAMDGDQELTDVIPVWQAAECNVVSSPESPREVTITAVGPGTRWVQVTADMPDGAQYNNGVDVTVNAVEVTSTIAINGVDYQATSLEDAIAQSGKIYSSTDNPAYMISEVSSIVFKSGVVRKADFDYIYDNKACFDFELKTFEIRDGVVLRGLANDEIPQQAFYLSGSSSVGLQHVYLGSQVKGLDTNSFGYCGKLLTFEGPGLTNIKGLGHVDLLTHLVLPGVTSLMGGPSGFSKGPYNQDRVAHIELPNLKTIGKQVFTTSFHPSDITLGAEIPEIYPNSKGGFDLPRDYPDINLHVPDEAIAAYKASPLYDESTGKWAGLKLIEPVAPAPQCEVQLTETALNMTRGDSGRQLSAKFLVDGVEVPDASITWTVDSQNVEISPESGTRIYVDAVAPCEGVVITASVTHEGQTYTADCVVNVANAYEVTFTDNHTNYVKYVAPDTSLGDNLQADRPSTATRKFLGWFNGETKATRDTVITGDITYEARYEILNTVEVVAADGTVTGYETFSAAVQEAPNGSTIRLIMDVYQGVAPEPLSENHIATNLTLDLNGHKLVGDEPASGGASEIIPIYVDAGAALTIRDSVGGGQIIAYESTQYGASSKGSHTAIWNKGTLTVESGTIISVKSVDNRDVEATAILNHGTLTVNGGEIYGFDANSVDARSKGCAIFAATGSARTMINGGKLVGTKLNTEDPSQSLAIDSGRDTVVSITGGQFYGSQKDVLSKYASCIQGGYFAHNFVDANDPALLIIGFEAQRGNLVDGQWTADEAGTLYRVEESSERLTVIFQGEGLTTTTIQVEKGQPIGDKMPEAPVKEGYKFQGWFENDVEINAQTTVSKAITATAKFEAVADRLTAKVNGTEFSGASLEALVADSGVAAKDITSLEPVSGEFTKADRDYMKTSLQYIETFTLNVSDTMRLLDDSGNPTTTLSSSSKIEFTAPQGWNPGPMRVLTLGGITDVEPMGLTGTIETLTLPDCINVSGLSLGYLKTLNLPKAKVLGNAALSHCTELVSLNLESVETLGWHSLEYTPKLKNLTLPATLKEIDDISFGVGGSKQGAVITFLGNTPPTVHANAFKNVGNPSKEAIALVPGGALENYVHVKFPTANVEGHLSRSQAMFGGTLALREAGTYRVRYCLDSYPANDRFAFVNAGSGLTEFQVPAVSAPEGQQFLGWNTKRNQTEATVEGVGYVPTADVTLYPVFAEEKPAEQYSVTFTADGMETVTRQIAGGQPVGQLPQAPAKEGYTFTGWFDGETEITSETPVSGPISARAVYSLNRYTVRFLNGGSLVEERIVEHGGTLSTLPANPTPEQDFKGWFLEDTEVKPGTVVTSDLTVTAVFGPERLFDRNVNFYVFLDDERTLAANRTDVTTLWIDGRQCIDGAALEAAYGKYGFHASDLADSDGMFLHTDRGQNDIWNAGIKTVDGVPYAATINHKEDTAAGAKGNEIDVYYLPRTSGDVNNYNDIIREQTFYSVTNDQDYEVIYVLNGTAVGEDRMPATPVWEEHIFTGWQTGFGEDAVDFTAETLVNSPLELVAKWQSDWHPVGVCMNQRTGTQYDTVAEAVDAAESGDTIVMIQDSTEGFVILHGNVTLELRGHHLTVRGLNAFSGNHVIDSSRAQGLLTVEGENLALAMDNRQMPLYTGSGYIFGTMTMQQKAGEVRDGAWTIVLKPLFIDGETSKNFFTDGVVDNQLTLGAVMSWTREDGSIASQQFEFTEDLVRQAYESGALTVTITGYENLKGFSAASSMESNTGVLNCGGKLVP